jgi:hypothetical protein
MFGFHMQPGPDHAAGAQSRSNAPISGKLATLPKGSYQQLHAAGLEPLRDGIITTVPWLGGRINELQEWSQFSLLSVESDRLPHWYRAGLLLIGDAAHVMSPVCGNGINYAVQDAAATANILSGPLKTRRISVRDLAAVQRRRNWPTRITQAIVNQLHDRVLGPVLAGQITPGPPPPLIASLVTYVDCVPGRPGGVEYRLRHQRHWRADGDPGVRSTDEAIR